MTPDTWALVVVRTCKQAIAPVREAAAGLAARLEALGDRLARLEAADAGKALALETRLAAYEAHLAAVEARPPTPGPPGQDGAAGRDGFGVEDLAAAFDGERTLTLTFAREGVPPKVFTLALPIPLYQGRWESSRTYAKGDVVTHSGSSWHCHAAATTAPPGESGSAWRLMVKRGDPGRDLRAAGALGARP